MIGHCTLLIEINGRKIVTDPYFALSTRHPFYRRLAPPAKTQADLADADLILVSHTHWDHIDSEYFCLLPDTVPVIVPQEAESQLKRQGAKTTVGMNAWDRQHFGDITITAVPASHRTAFQTRGVPAIGFVIQGQVYFAGDTFYHPFMAQIGQQFQLDVALIPVTTYLIPMTMDCKGAVRAVQALRPSVVIPIHLGIRPRLPLIFGGKHSPERLLRHLSEAGAQVQVVILEEGGSYDY